MDLIRNKQFIPIALLSLVNVLGFTILIPVLPFVVQKFGGSPIMYGALLSAYPTFQFLGAPLLGSLSDKYGRRPILLVSQAGTFLSWIIFGTAYFVPNISIFSLPVPIIVIALSRVVDGITGGNSSVANAYIADITKPADRTKAFGLVGGIVGVGLLVGPVIGGFSNSFNIEFLGTAITALIISGLTLVFMHRFLKESLQEKNQDSELEIKLLDEINIYKKAMKFRDNKIISRLLFIRIFFTFAFSSYTSIFALFIIDKFGLSSRDIGLLFLLFGSFFIFNQSFVSRKIADKTGDMKTFYIGQVITAIGLSTMTLAFNLTSLIIIAYIVNLGISLSFPTLRSLLTKNVSEKKQGEITGIDQSLFAAGSALAPLAAGTLYISLSQTTFVIFALILSLPYLIFTLKT